MDFEDSVGYLLVDFPIVLIILFLTSLVATVLSVTIFDSWPMFWFSLSLLLIIAVIFVYQKKQYNRNKPSDDYLSEEEEFDV